MAARTRQKKELCAICSGGLMKFTITHEERRGINLFLFENVPAQVCAGCGEIWFDEATLQQIDRLIKEGEPTRKVKTPIYDFALVLSQNHRPTPA